MRDVFNPSKTYATADVSEYRIGQRITNYDGEEFLFVKAAAAITVGMVVLIGEAFNGRGATTGNAAKEDRIGVAKTAIANGFYGWVCIYGSGDISVAASCGADVALNTTGTAGRADDASTEVIDGIKLTTARSGTAGNAPGLWHYPTMA